MKFTIRLLLITALATGSRLSAADPTFHLKNKSKGEIKIDIIQNGKSLLKGLEPVKKNGDFTLKSLNTTQDTMLDIYYCPTSDWCKTNLPNKFSVTIYASFVPNKTVYLKFSGNKIEPQKGDALGKTTKGYSTKNNVTDKDFSPAKITSTPGNTVGMGIKRDQKVIENEAWTYFPVTEKDRLLSNTLPNEFWIKVLSLDYTHIINLPLDQSYSQILKTQRKNFDIKLAELKKIHDPEVRNKAEEILITAMEQTTKFIKTLIAQREAKEADFNAKLKAMGQQRAKSEKSAKPTTQQQETVDVQDNK